MTGVQTCALPICTPGAVIMVGERLAGVPGALSAAARLATSTGAALAWVPRRAGERGALDAGALAGLLPGGRPIADAAARAEVAAVWGVEPSALPSAPGMSTDVTIDEILRDAQRTADGEPRVIDAVVIAGLQIEDHPRAAELRQALAEVPFVVSLATHGSEISEFADVVFPVAVVTEKAGGFTDWEGRVRPFAQAVHGTHTLPDGRVLGMIADAMDVPFGLGDVAQLREELDRLTPWSGPRAAAPNVSPVPPSGGVRLAT